MKVEFNVVKFYFLKCLNISVASLKMMFLIKSLYKRGLHLMITFQPARNKENIPFELFYHRNQYLYHYSNHKYR